MFSLDLQPGERLFRIYRQSEWTLAKTVLWIFLLVYLPSWLLIRANLLLDYACWYAVWCVLIFLYGLYKYLLWLINVSIVTDKRLVLVHYESLFKKHVKEAPLTEISNISYRTTGFISSVLNFGDVEVRVAGLPEPLILPHLRKPHNLKDFLWSLRGTQQPAQPL